MQPYAEHRDKPWGYEIIYTAPDFPHVGKILHVTAGCKLSLQYHTEKEETITLYSGKALLWVQEKEGDPIEKVPMELQKGYQIPVLLIHRLEALEDSLFLEASSPETGTTVRLEDDYKRPDETR